MEKPFISKLVEGNQIAEKIADNAWDIFSLVNGNPDYNFSAIRFCLAIFFLVMLYTIIKMRVVAAYQVKHIVALSGVVFMIFRESTMLFMQTGWEIGLYRDLAVHFLWPPVEHTFEGLSFLCLAWYSIETACMFEFSYYMKKFKFIILGLFMAFSTYTMIIWKTFFIQHYPKVLFMYRECMVDWQSHILMSFIASIGFYASFQRQSRYLIMFWSVTLFEHFSRTLTYYFEIHNTGLDTLYNALHIWAIPLLILHFVDAYVLKISNCNTCKRDIFL